MRLGKASWIHSSVAKLCILVAHPYRLWPSYPKPSAWLCLWLRSLLLRVVVLAVEAIVAVAAFLWLEYRTSI